MRTVLMPDGTRRQEEVSDYAYRLFRQIKGENLPLTEAFVDAQSLAPADHVRVQAAVQKYIDSSISKTINVPEEIDFESFKDIYLMAYEQGCKGCTTYRPNDITGSVLTIKKDEKKSGEAPVAQQAELPLQPVAKPVHMLKPRDPLAAGGVIYMTKPLDRPEALPGRTYKITWPDSEHAMYITLNDILQDGRLRPFEVFVNSKNTEHYAWTVALTRMISAVFRRGGDVSFVVDELKAVFDPRGGHWMGGKYVPSLLAAIGGVIEQHLIAIGFMANPNDEREEAAVLALAANAESPKPLSGLRQCPKCGQPGLIKSEGCDTCTSCGYSKCG
jgi:ribonucleoside-diphosphate reductase alpha chain